MRRTMTECKAKYKDSYIQTRLDTDKMTLKVSYRNNGIWYNDVETVELPDSVYDLTNKVTRVIVPTPEGMDLDGGDSVQG